MNKFNKYPTNFICQKVLPLTYDESLSYLELLTKLINFINTMTDNVNSLIDKHNELIKSYSNAINNIDNLNNEIELMKKDNYLIKNKSINFNKFSTSCVEEIENFIMTTVKNIAKYVTFGLDDDGNFIALIPENFIDITFDTTENGEMILKL